MANSSPCEFGRQVRSYARKCSTNSAEIGKVDFPCESLPSESVLALVNVDDGILQIQVGNPKTTNLAAADPGFGKDGEKFYGAR